MLTTLIIGFGTVTIAGLFATIGVIISVSRHNNKLPNGIITKIEALGDKMEEIRISHATTIEGLKNVTERVDRLENSREWIHPQKA